MNKIMMTKLDDTHNNGIYKSNYDSRIMITSSIPISVTQNCFFHNKIGDSFAGILHSLFIHSCNYNEVVNTMM